MLGENEMKKKWKENSPKWSTGQSETVQKTKKNFYCQNISQTVLSTLL